MRPFAPVTPACNPAMPRARAARGQILAGLSAVLLALLAGPAAAETQLKAGLWEQSVNMTSDSGRLEAAMTQARQAMAGLPPQQRQMMEQMMARNGIAMGAGGQNVRTCMTQAMVERNQIPQEPGCQQTASRNGDTWTVNFSCPQQKTSGEGTVTLESPTRYRGQFRMKAQLEGGMESVNMATEGRWLGADCGNMKPAGR